MRSNSHRQSGYSTFTAVAAFVGLGIVFFAIFMFSLSGGNKGANSGDQQSGTEQEQPTSTSNEPPYIRIPENSKIYLNETYGFSFAYPDSFGELTSKSESSGSAGESYRAESALAAQKPVGNGATIMNGRLGVHVYSKESFKIVVNNNDVSVGPTKTGNDTTWKIVSRGSSGQDISIGDAYAAKSVKSQTGVTVFDFAYSPASNFRLGRWVFEAGDKYVMITMPSVSKLDASNLDQSDLEPYITIGTNIAKTVRVKATVATDTSNTSQPSDDDTNTSNNDSN